MIAYDIKIECEEDGFYMLIETTEDDSVLRFSIPEPEAFYDHVKAAIGPWLYEKHQAHQLASSVERLSTGRGLNYDQGYDLSDPKHPDFHSVHADTWDQREGK